MSATESGPSIEQAFEAAAAAHGEGRLDDAERLYLALLDRERRHPATLHALGLLRAQQGRFGDAIKLLRRAVDAAPGWAEAHIDLGAAFQAANRLGDAIERYRRGLALAPDHAGAHYNLASALQARGALAEAVAHYEAALERAPDLAEAHANLGAALIALGRLPSAIEPLRRAIALKPDALEAHNQLGASLQQLGRLDEACAVFANAANTNPNVAVFHSNLGAVLGLMSRDNDAMRAFEHAIRLAPDFADAHDNLGILQHRYGRLEAAKVCFERAIAIAPNQVSAHNNLGMTLQGLGRHEAAMVAFRAALAVKPDYAPAHNNLATSLMAVGRTDEAIATYETALRLWPGFAQAHYNLGNALVAADRPEDAIARYQKALALQPAYAEAHNNLGNVLSALHRDDEAMASYQRAFTLDPRLSNAYMRLASTLGALGRFDEARAHLAKAIAITPNDVLLLCRHAAFKRFMPDDPDLARLEAFLPDEAALPVQTRTALHFALAQAYEQIGEPARAFDHLITGNELHRQQVVYDEPWTMRQMERTAELFTPAVMARHRDVGEPSPVPIFVVGMPRSGTTLIEQILASHPSVFGAGELATFPHIIDRHTAATGAPFPDLITSIGAAALRRMGSDYVGAVKGLGPDALRIVDKMPANFVHAGLIHLALPGARIIHAHRNPVDTCTSCFSIQFTTGQHFTYELGELGRYYRAYAALMAHWRAVLPPEVLIDVRYEDLVDDLEGQARRIVTHCDLPWDDQCLAFHTTERAVRTASALQVREPIYRRSVGRWRRFGDRLGPLLEALGPEFTTG